VHIVFYTTEKLSQLLTIMIKWQTWQTCSGELIPLPLNAEAESVSVKLVPSSELCELKEMESARCGNCHVPPSFNMGPSASNPTLTQSTQLIFKDYTRWFKYDRDKLWLVYTQIVPVIYEPPFNYNYAYASHKQYPYNEWPKSKIMFKMCVSTNTG
jgi:hypothetical protein